MRRYDTFFSDGITTTRPLKGQKLDTPRDTDRALQELRRLREGRGLTPDRLANCSNLMSAVGTSDPGEASDILRAVLGRLGDGERLRALRVDFGHDLEALLGRPPIGREIDFLGERRNAYATLIGRDVKTLSRWSDKTVAELRSHLITDQFDGRIIVAAGVKSRRVNGVEVMCYEEGDTELSSGRTTGYKNPEDSSLPLIMYGFPRDWRPASIGFVVAFLGGDHPQRVWALVADSVLDVGFGHERTALSVDPDDTAKCRIDHPRRDQLYGIWWEW